MQFIVFCLWSGLGLVQVPQRVEGRREAENTENTQKTKGSCPGRGGVERGCLSGGAGPAVPSWLISPSSWQRRNGDLTRFKITGFRGILAWLTGSQDACADTACLGSPKSQDDSPFYLQLFFNFPSGNSFLLRPTISSLLSLPLAGATLHLGILLLNSLWSRKISGGPPNWQGSRR